MNEPKQPDTLPLDYAAQIIFELNSMRRECSELAMKILNRRPFDEAHLEECARLDEALARAHGLLYAALEGIRSGRK